MENDFTDVIGRGFDAGVRYEERIAKDTIVVPIGPRRQRFIAAASPAYVKAEGAPRHPRDLLTNHKLIGNRFPSGAMWTWEFEWRGKQLRVVPDGPLTSSSVDLQLACAVSGAGIIYKFEDFLRPHLESGKIVPLLEDWWPEFEGPYLYYQSRRQMPSPLRLFFDCLKELRSSEKPNGRK